MKKTSLLVASALLASSALFAQDSVTSNVVGYITTTTPAGDDNILGASLTQAPVFEGASTDVTGAVITVASTFTADAYNNTHYALATSGTNAGQWSEIVDTSANTITTADPLISTGDSVKVIPFWTLATLFPNGNGVGSNADPFNPTATVLINSATAEGTNLSAGAVYLHYAGGGGIPAGWYKTGDFASGDNVVITPDTYVTIRNSTSGSITTTITGTVPSDVVGSAIAANASSAQDNQMVNPYPAAMTLDSSDLTSVVSAAVDPFNPTDTVLIYDPENSSGINISAANVYLYYGGGGGIPAGWYQTGNFAASGSVEIPAQGAFIVRKGADGVGATSAWNPALPYSL